MSKGLFEHLNETEAYVFSFVAYFACDEKKGNVFKRTTVSLCNNLGYSANTVRATIERLVQKNFLSRTEKPQSQTKNLRYNYFDDIAHHLEIGSDGYALEFSSELSKLLNGLRAGSKNNKPSLKNVFFKVYVTALQAKKKGEKWKRNQSRHLHKALVLHGFLHNKVKFREQFAKTPLSLSVPYLSTMMQWSRNTIRRIINTLAQLGLITMKIDGRRIVFTRIKMAERIRVGYNQLKSRLFSSAQPASNGTDNSTQKPIGLSRPAKDATPAEHSAFLAAMKSARNL